MFIQPQLDLLKDCWLTNVTCVPRITLELFFLSKDQFSNYSGVARRFRLIATELNYVHFRRVGTLTQLPICQGIEMKLRDKTVQTLIRFDFGSIDAESSTIHLFES